MFVVEGRRQEPVLWWAAASLAGMLLGGFGPWASALGVSVSGTSGDGWLVIAPAAVAAVALFRHMSARGLGSAALVLLGGATGSVVAVYDRVHASSVIGQAGGLTSALVQIGWGLNLAAASSISLVVAALVLIAKTGTAIAPTSLISTQGVIVDSGPMRRECPHCREFMRRDASVCPHCQRDSEAWAKQDGRWWRFQDGSWRYLDEQTDRWVERLSPLEAEIEAGGLHHLLAVGDQSAPVGLNFISWLAYSAMPILLPLLAIFTVATVIVAIALHWPGGGAAVPTIQSPIDVSSLYQGTARVLLPTAVEAQFESRAGFKAATPSPEKRDGFINGWEATYSDLGGSEANVAVAVYRDPESALAAYTVACPTCKILNIGDKVPGARVKDARASGAQVGHKNLVCIGAPAVRGTVYIGVTSCAPNSYGYKKLEYDAGYLIGVVFAKATG